MGTIAQQQLNIILQRSPANRVAQELQDSIRQQTSRARRPSTRRLQSHELPPNQNRTDLSLIVRLTAALWGRPY